MEIIKQQKREAKELMEEKARAEKIQIQEAEKLLKQREEYLEQQRLEAEEQEKRELEIIKNK